MEGYARVNEYNTWGYDALGMPTGYSPVRDLRASFSMSQRLLFDLHDSTDEEDLSPPMLKNLTMETRRFMEDAQLTEYMEDMDRAGFGDIFKILEMYKEKQLPVFFGLIGMMSTLVQKKFKAYLTMLKNSAYIPRGKGAKDTWLAPGALFVPKKAKATKQKKEASIDTLLKGQAAVLSPTIAKKILGAFPKERVLRSKQMSTVARKHFKKVAGAVY